jgi:predicted RNA-binding Zn ribbon-like protein
LDDYRSGAALATALVNTAAEVQSRGDQLADLATLRRFLCIHELGPKLPHPPTETDLVQIHQLRRTLRDLIAAPTADALITIASGLTLTVGAGPTLEFTADGRWQWSIRARPDATIAEQIGLVTATALLAVLRTLGPDRFRDCASPSCDGVFVDTSKGGRRRYCEPQICGNRVNVAAYRARRREFR